uniref:Attachment surface glycoprotein n=1 Tax=human metapneumovirus TaxID=162145 RepID=U3P9R8_9MONO|nr:attachment surface glycoprotein [Human metapneumovirus]AGW43069.1 attachment surface glycoprotein [Human metapneumovirus]AGW43077.1 attachment surface glycoprotein [Human metapneumovirus]AGW43079.1 attachment surface glycoprotein [Human metapneumovirus]
MEVKVENIRAIDMFKARVKNRVARSKCFKNASLILIGITTLSIALNIYLIINYTIQKTTSESEHHTSSPPTESNKETSTIPIDNPDINPNSQYPTQQSTEGPTLYPASSVSPSETEPASTPGTTNRPSFVDRFTTQPSGSRTKTNPTVHKENIPSTVSRTHSPTRTTAKAATRATAPRMSSTRERPTTTSVQSDSSTTTQNHEETGSANPQASASTMQK